jgi:proline iminopeptidase
MTRVTPPGRTGEGQISPPPRAGHDRWAPAREAVTGVVGSRRGGLAASVGVAAASGAVTAVVLPRGPVTVGQAWALLITGLLAGAAAGMLARSRWALLLAPAEFAAGFEITLGLAGHPAGYTMGWFIPRSGIAFAALISGRLVTGLVAFPAMMLGVIAGGWAARRISRAGPGAAGHRHARARAAGLITAAARGAGVVLLAVAVAAIGWALSLPGHVPAITSAAGKPVPGSIARWEHPSIGGVDQWVLLYGRSVHNPVLLFLSGGPGGSELENLMKFDRPLAGHFTLAVWEQRGSGKSYPSIDAAPLTVNRQVNDVTAVTDWLRHRFGVPKIYLLGHSYGSILGTLAVQRHPGRYYAYIGTGQMVATIADDRIEYRALLGYAQRTGDTSLARQLRSWGEPPYYGQDVTRYTTMMGEVATKLESPHVSIQHASNFNPPEYGVLDKINTFRGFADAGPILYQDMQRIDLRRSVPALAVPVYFVSGKYDFNAAPSLVRQYFNLLQAPRKQFIIVGHAAHGVVWDQARWFEHFMTGTVLAQTQPKT